jgi:hypothetical protein
MCPTIAAITITIGSHTKGVCVIQTFAGSLVKTRSGVGVESIAMVTMFASRASPIQFQTRTPQSGMRPAASSAATASAEIPVTMSKFHPE